jgi:glycine/D-amino acid oxidase-like deaminating enzyme
VNLHSGTPFWLAKNAVTTARPTLRVDDECDVLIVGAGVTGALIAHATTAAGLDTVVLDRRESGIGSTAASTALLQYEIDLELLALGEKIGIVNAQRAYLASARAVASIAALATDLGECDIMRRSSMYLATTRRDARRLQQETMARAEIGLEVEWWPRERVTEQYGFPSHGAIRSEASAEIDALAFTRQLLERAVVQGARWYEQTHISRYVPREGGVTLKTATGNSLKARIVVCATGYDLPDFWKQDRVALHSTYALATERLDHFGPWDDRCLVWESARPYCYMRTSSDRRIIIGGEDVSFKNATLRDRIIPDKTKRLEQRLKKLLPALETETAFEWAGTFAETPDGLPYIGRDAAYPGVLFALGYGGNGITFSAIAAELLTAECLNQTARDADLFRLDR